MREGKVYLLCVWFTNLFVFLIYFLFFAHFRQFDLYHEERKSFVSLSMASVTFARLGYVIRKAKAQPINYKKTIEKKTYRPNKAKVAFYRWITKKYKYIYYTRAAPIPWQPNMESLVIVILHRFGRSHHGRRPRNCLKLKIHFIIILKKDIRFVIPIRWKLDQFITWTANGVANVEIMHVCKLHALSYGGFYF